MSKERARKGRRRGNEENRDEVTKVEAKEGKNRLRSERREGGWRY